MRRKEKGKIKERIERLRKNLKLRDPEFSNRDIIRKNIKKLEERLNEKKTKVS